MQLDQEANSFAGVACLAISNRFPEMVSDDEAQIIGADLKRFLQIPLSGNASLTHSAVDVIVSTTDISVTDISMDRDLYEKGMNKWLDTMIHEGCGKPTNVP